MLPSWPRWQLAVPLLFIVTLAASACSRSGIDTTVATTESTGTTSDVSTTGGTDATTSSPDSTAGSTTTVAAPDSTTSTVAVEVPEYSIESRTGGTGGDTVVILLEPGTYTDLDLETIVVDVVERFAPVATVHVVDDSSVVPLVLEDLSALAAEEQALLDLHYFARLEEGFRLVFQGPFATVGQVILGS